MDNLFFEISDKDAILINPGFGFRFFGPGPVPQCIDTVVMIFAQRKKLRIFRHEKIYGMILVWKLFFNMK